MSGLKGLWCFYIAREGNNAQRVQVLTPKPPMHTPSLSFTPRVLSLAPYPFTQRHAWTNICLPTSMHFFLSQIDTLMHGDTHTRMPGPCCPITTPCGPFGFCLCLMSVGSAGHSSAGAAQPGGIDQDLTRCPTLDISVEELCCIQTVLATNLQQQIGLGEKIIVIDFLKHNKEYYITLSFISVIWGYYISHYYYI